MAFLFSFVLSIFFFISAFNVQQVWTTIVCFVMAAVFWVLSGIIAEKSLWNQQDHEVQLNNLEQRVSELESRGKNDEN